MPLGLERARSADRLVVVWRVTTRCNLACGFCAYDRTLPFARRDADEVSARRLGQALARTRDALGRELHVSFLGGEPLAWEPLPRVARYFSELGLSLGITSNGVGLTNASLRELLLDYFDEVTLSIDGVAAVHDALRAWPGGFRRLASAISALGNESARRGRGPRLRVNTVLMRDNIGQFPELGRVLASLGVHEVTFNRLGGRDRPEFFSAHRLRPSELEQFARELPELRRELSQRGLSILGAHGYLERLLSLEREQPVAVGDCEPGRRFLFVDERGQIAPCSFTLDSYAEPGADAFQPTGDLSDLPRRFLLRQRSQRASACDDCASTQVFEKFKGA